VKNKFLLSGIMALASLSMYGMESERPAIYSTLDKLTASSIKPHTWPAIFAIVDSRKNTIDINKYRKCGSTLLELAVLYQSFSATKDLLEKYQANPNLHSDIFTPLNIACYHQDIPMIKLLLDYGANPHIGALNWMKVHWGDQELYNAFYWVDKNPDILQLLDNCSIALEQ